MNILFAAGDVGGARALLPVAHAAQRSGHMVLLLDNRALSTEAPAHWTRLDVDSACAAPADIVLYGSSVSDPAPARVAAAARAQGRPIVHLLDNWMNYAQRLLDSTGQRLVPDLYLVMDDQARQEAIADGVPPEILQISGHPNLATLAHEATEFGAPASPVPILFYPSEPVIADQGPASDSQGRGYDEVSLGHQLAPLLGQTLPKGASLHVAPHPREDRTAVTEFWQGLAHQHFGDTVSLQIVPPNGVRKALHGATHVLGMTSILLYEAWLLGRPTASFQPGLRMDTLRSLHKRQGLSFCDDGATMAQVMAALLAKQPGPAKPDLDRHRTAASRVLRLATDLKTTT